MQQNGCSTEYSAKQIILVVWQASLGGAEKIIADYFKYLFGKFSFSLYALKGYNKKIDFFGKYNVDIITGHTNPFLLYIKFFFYAYKHRKTVFHIFNAGPVILLILRLALVRRVIYHIHGTIYWRSTQQKIIQKSLWFLALNKRVVIVANSKHSKKCFQDRISKKFNIIVIYNPFDTDLFLEIEKKQSNELIISYVGRIARGKNLDLWIDLAAYIHNIFPESQFRLIGEGPLRHSLEQKVKSMNLSDTIRFEGYISDMNRIYEHCDLLLFLSDHESFGNVVVESVLTGTPVIASSIPSMKEIFERYPQFLVDLDDNIYNSVVSKIKDLNELRRYALQAREEFSKKYTLKNHFDEFTKLYLA